MNDKKRRTLVSIVAIILVIVMAVGLIAGALSMSVRAASSSEIQSQIDSLEDQAGNIDQQKSDLQSQIDAKQGQQDDMIYQKSIIDQQMTITQEEIANTTAQIEQYTQLISEKEAELSQSEENEATLYAQYKERLRAMEENGNVTYWSILFKASSFSDLLDRIDMIQEIASVDQDMMDSLATMSEEIRTKRAELEQSQTDMETQKGLLAEQEATLADQSAQAQVLIDQYASESDELQGTYAQYDAMEADVVQKIADAQTAYQQAVSDEEAARKAAEAAAAAEEAAKKAAEEKSNTTTNGGTTTSGDATTNGGTTTSGDTTASPSAGSGTFICPLSTCVVTSPYGYRVHPITGVYKFHSGVDLSAASGTPIYATASGTVSITSYDSSSGNYVMISHSGGFASAYMHMTYYIVSVGDYVTQGQVIGYVGTTGASTGPHLHFMIYYNGATVNPMDYI
ncbi:MAG: peptidoglycan DD-metalloendopeptidase family protein [Oscillospiraceae bacterium]|nr:peptidoglycan DD-metalloendopeptidase family protein [Oscillospiraceae bacterium]